MVRKRAPRPTPEQLQATLSVAELNVQRAEFKRTLDKLDALKAKIDADDEPIDTWEESSVVKHIGNVLNGRDH